MKTLLQIVQTFCKTTGLSVPVTVSSSTDTQVIQLLALINEGLDNLVVMPWSQLEKVATFVSTSVENQGALATIAPGFRSLIGDTLWSNTNRLIGAGSISPQDSQALRIWGTPSALVQFREVGGNLLFIPAGPASLTYSFEYKSHNAVIAADLSTKQYFTLDSDTTILPDSIILADLRWRWKAEKELAYAENFRTFENLCKQAVVSSATKQAVSMATSRTSMTPGVVVPFGNWAGR